MSSSLVDAEPFPSSDAVAPKVGTYRRGSLFAVAAALVMFVGLSCAWPAWSWYRATSWRQDCQMARASGDWHKELASATAWGSWDPNCGEAWLFAAEAAENLENYREVATFLGRVPDQDPKALPSYVEKANLEWTVLNDPLEAERTSERILALDGRVVEVHSRLISFYGMTSQRIPMLRAIRRAMAAGAEPREAYTYLIMADHLTFTNGADLNARWLAGSPDEIRFKVGLGIHTAIGIEAAVDTRRTGDGIEWDEESKRQLQWFLEQIPHDTVLLAYMLHRAREAGDPEEVGRLLAKVREDGVDDHMIWVFRGWYHTYYGEETAAEDAFRQALRLHPLSPSAHHEYAEFLRKFGRSGVEREQHLAAQGRQLRADLLRLPKATDLTSELFERIAAYARECGDEQVADALAKRLGPHPLAAPIPVGF